MSLFQRESQSARLRLARLREVSVPVGTQLPQPLGRSRAVAWPRGRPPPSCPQRSGSWTGPRVDLAGVGRGRALPPHVHDAAAFVGRDAAAGARAVAPLDELELAPAG